MSVKGGLLCFAAITGAKVALNLQSRHDTEETKLVKSNTSSTQSASRTSSKHKQTSPQLMPLPSLPTSPTPSLTTISSSSDSSSRKMSPTFSSFSSSVSSTDETETFARPQEGKSRWLPLTADHYPPPFTPQPTKTLRNPSIESLRDGRQDDFKSKGLDPLQVQTDFKTFNGVHRCMKHPSAMLVMMTTGPLTEELEEIQKAAKHVCLPCLVQSYVTSVSASEGTTLQSFADEGSVMRSEDGEKCLANQAFAVPYEQPSGGERPGDCGSPTIEKGLDLQEANNLLQTVEHHHPDQACLPEHMSKDQTGNDDSKVGHLQSQEVQEESAALKEPLISAEELLQESCSPSIQGAKEILDQKDPSSDEQMERENTSNRPNDSVKNTNDSKPEKATVIDTTFNKAAFHINAQNIAPDNTGAAGKANLDDEQSTQAHEKSKQQNPILSSFEELNQLQQDDDAMDRVQKQLAAAQTDGLFVSTRDQEVGLTHVFPSFDRCSEEDVEYYPAYEPKNLTEHENNDHEVHSEQHQSMAPEGPGIPIQMADEDTSSKNMFTAIEDPQETKEHVEHAADMILTEPIPFTVAELTDASEDTASPSSNSSKANLSSHCHQSNTDEKLEEPSRDMSMVTGDLEQEQVTASERCTEVGSSPSEYLRNTDESACSSFAEDGQLDTPMSDADNSVALDWGGESQKSDRPETKVVVTQDQQEMAFPTTSTMTNEPGPASPQAAEGHRREIKALLSSFVDYREREKLLIISENLLAKGIPFATVKAGLLKLQAEKRAILSYIPQTPSPSPSSSRPSIFLDSTKTPEFNFSGDSEVSFGSGSSSPVGGGSPTKVTHQKPSVKAESDEEDDGEGRLTIPACRVKKVFKIGGEEEETKAPLLQDMEKKKPQHEVDAGLQPEYGGKGTEVEMEDPQKVESRPEEGDKGMQKLREGNASEGCKNAPVAGKTELEEPESGGVESESARKEARKKSKKERRRAGKGKKN